ncbi:MAG: ribbon-helix-helix domain-containing protein [Syntrophorhabdaceae bacterium]|nr:ribbon-helix-helix domain-containing protein [Syntrophorhabdaceae bacterium]
MQMTISTRFDEDTLTRLDETSAAMKRPRSALIKEAVTRYLDYLAWYEVEIQKGVDDLAAGRVKSHAEVKDRVRELGFHVD